MKAALSFSPAQSPARKTSYIHRGRPSGLDAVLLSIALFAGCAQDVKLLEQGVPAGSDEGVLRAYAAALGFDPSDATYDGRELLVGGDVVLGEDHLAAADGNLEAVAASGGTTREVLLDLASERALELESKAGFVEKGATFTNVTPGNFFLADDTCVWIDSRSVGFDWALAIVQAVNEINKVPNADINFSWIWSASSVGCGNHSWTIHAEAKNNLGGTTIARAIAPLCFASPFGFGTLCVPGNTFEINLANSPATADGRRHAALHEFGHSLGLNHWDVSPELRVFLPNTCTPAFCTVQNTIMGAFMPANPSRVFLPDDKKVLAIIH